VDVQLESLKFLILLPWVAEREEDTLKDLAYLTAKSSETYSNLARVGTHLPTYPPN
jgi:hypothetical protein